MCITKNADSFEEQNLQAILEKIAQEEGFKQPVFSVNMALPPGGNFIGRVFRVVIKEKGDGNQGRCHSLIFKATPSNKARQEALAADDLFLTESEMYHIVLPALNKLLNKHGVVSTSTFPGMARCFLSELKNCSNTDTSAVLVLEDMRARGFVSADVKKVSLDDVHCRLILQKLAVMHAASLALRFYEPEAAEQLGRMISKNIWTTNIEHPLLDDLREGCIKGLSMLPEPYKNGHAVYDRLRKIVEDFHAEYIKINSVPKDLACINHADCWCNNILFKYGKDGILEDVCLIDLQLSRVGSPAIDISYMIFLCTSKETRDAHYDDLIHSYHDEVSKNLRALGCDPEKIIPWDVLQKHLRLYGRMGVLTALFALPLMLGDEFVDEDDTVLFDTVKITRPETFDKVSKRLAGVVEDAARWGYI